MTGTLSGINWAQLNNALKFLSTCISTTVANMHSIFSSKNYEKEGITMWGIVAFDRGFQLQQFEIQRVLTSCCNWRLLLVLVDLPIGRALW